MHIRVTIKLVCGAICFDNVRIYYVYATIKLVGVTINFVSAPIKLVCGEKYLKNIRIYYYFVCQTQVDSANSVQKKALT